MINLKVVRLLSGCAHASVHVSFIAMGIDISVVHESIDVCVTDCIGPSTSR